jgi:hypothetical protein
MAPCVQGCALQNSSSADGARTLRHKPFGIARARGPVLDAYRAWYAVAAAWVDACARTRQEAVSAPREVSGVRRAARERFSSAIGLGTATRGVTDASFALLSPSNRPVPKPIELDPRDILAAVLATSGISLDHHPYGRPRALSRARRAALAIWGLTGRPRSTMVRALGITSAAATKLAQSASERDPQLAALVTNALELLGHPPAGTL